MSMRNPAWLSTAWRLTNQNSATCYLVETEPGKAPIVLAEAKFEFDGDYAQIAVIAAKALEFAQFKMKEANRVLPVPADAIQQLDRLKIVK